MEDTRTEKPRKLFDHLVWCFIGLFLILLGVTFTAIFFSSDKTVGIEEFFLGIGFLILGLSAISPQIIGSRIKRILKQLFQPIIHLWLKVFSRIKKRLPEESVNGLFENRIFLAIFFFAFAGLEWYGANTAQGNKQILLAFGVVFFAIMGLVSLFPKVMKITGYGALCLVGIGIAFWIVSAIAEAMGAIPFAIIVGALIIASAISAKK